jgi:transcriptional regulator with XRE-family HTH domain
MPSQIRVLLGRNVCKLRTDLSLTQEELAAKIGMNRSYLARVESGKARASVDLIGDLALGVEVNPDILLKDCSGNLATWPEKNGKHHAA